MASDFRAALELADRAMVLELHSPRDIPPELADVTAAAIADGSARVEFVAEKAEAERRLGHEPGEGDLCVVLCPGDPGLAGRLVDGGG